MGPKSQRDQSGHWALSAAVRLCSPPGRAHSPPRILSVNKENFVLIFGQDASELREKWRPSRSRPLRGPQCRLNLWTQP